MRIIFGCLAVAALLNNSSADEFDRRFVRLWSIKESARYSDASNIACVGDLAHPNPVDLDKLRVRLRLYRGEGGKLKIMQEETTKLTPHPKEQGIYQFSYTIPTKQARPPGHYIVRVDILDLSDEQHPSIARDSVFIEVVPTKPKPEPKVTRSDKPSGVKSSKLLVRASAGP